MSNGVLAGMLSVRGGAGSIHIHIIRNKVAVHSSRANCPVGQGVSNSLQSHGTRRTSRKLAIEVRRLEINQLLNYKKLSRTGEHLEHLETRISTGGEYHI